MSMSPNIYTIDPSVSFMDALVSGLLTEAGGDPLKLSSVTVLVPNRRAQRSLQEAFLRALEHRTTLLPMIRAIGDVDEDEVTFLGAGIGLDPSEILPAVQPVRRQVMLMRYVMAWGGFGQTLAPAQGWRLAGELARFMDQVDTEGLSYGELASLVPESLASHWDVTLEFLKIVTETWPQIMADEGTQNPAVRRDTLLHMLAAAWAAKPPKGQVIAAGSTGSIPATANLLKTVACMPNGKLVLPGFDRDMSDEVWASMDPTHPQSMMKNLIEVIGASRHEVELWPSVSAANQPTIQRAGFLRDAMLPADLTRAWRSLGYSGTADQDLFGDMQAIVAPTRRDEADAIAVLMRETLEVSGKTAALITPDRQLARHVRASLQRWSIDIDDSGGDRVLNTVPGRLLALIADAVSDNMGPVALLALLQHPLVCGGQTRRQHLKMVRALDRDVLRGVRPAGGLEGLLDRAQQAIADSRKKFGEDDLTALTAVVGVIEPLMKCLKDTPILAEILKAHIQCAEALAASVETEGDQVLWAGDAGHALAEAVAELIEETGSLADISAGGYASLFAEILSPKVVRPVWRKHPRLSIWSPLEARLQRTDIMILGGLNEGVWPGEIQSDPWMNRTMRAEFKLPPLERRIGQSAHDFMQAASGGTVYMTRAKKVDGSPTVPSRWWFRIEALAGRPIPAANQYLAWAEALAESPRLPMLQPPAPTPPLSARPKRLSVTQVETWMRDPYGLYANKILGLRTLDPVDDRPTASTKGTLLHEALELFLKEPGPKFGEEGLDRMIAVGRRVFSHVITQPTVYAFWWPRFEKIAEWFVANEEKRTEKYEVAAVEVRAEVLLPGEDFTLVAKADRIDRIKENGTLQVIDYKTGNVPSAKRVAAGFAPQLPLEAWLAQQGGFEGLPATSVSDLIYWELKGGDPVQQQKKPVKDVDHTVEAAIQGLYELVQVFSAEKTPYLSNPRPKEAGYGDYDHLARVKEWRGGSDPFSEEGDS